MENKQTQDQDWEKNIGYENWRAKSHTKWCPRPYIDPSTFHNNGLIAKRKAVVKC